MRTKMTGTAFALILITLLSIVSLGCAKMSESIRKPSAGMNGGFEHTKSDLPVNWIVYSPSTIPTGNYELSFDTEDFKEGKQSLKFLVHECSATGGRHSPGITQEYPAKPGESYLVSYWVKNDGCSYTVIAGGVDAKTGHYETIDSSPGRTQAWKFVKHEFKLPRKYKRVRFELSIRSPGRLWIDDVKIEQITRESSDTRARPK
jgi:hypothetical protein